MYRNCTSWMLLTTILASLVLLSASASHERSKPVGHRRKYRHTKKVEIPADLSLLGPEVPEDVELRLAHEGIGLHSDGGTGRQRGPVSNSPSIQDEGAINAGIIEFVERKVMSLPDEANALYKDTARSGAESTRKLLHELRGLKENIENEIARLQGHPDPNDQKMPKRTNILVRASRELVKRAELDSGSPNTVEREMLVPYRACIYIDVPGKHGKDEGEPLLPENLLISRKHNSFQIQSVDQSVHSSDKAEEPDEVSNKIERVQTNVNHIQQQQQPPPLPQRPLPPPPPRPPPVPPLEPQRPPPSRPQPPPETESDDAAVEDVLWLHMPPNDPLDAEGMRSKLYNTVDNLHHDGKDVLFIPISKTYADTDDVKHGFLKSLQINPERYDKDFKSLRVKRL